MSDCAKYTGRRKQICQGVEADGTPLRMSSKKRRQYLDRWEGNQGGSAANNASKFLKCRHQGEKRGQEPCGCGGSSFAEVFDCNIHKIELSKGKEISRKCVNLRRQHQKIRDNQAYLCCESCACYAPEGSPSVHPVCTPSAPLQFAVGVTTAPRNEEEPTINACIDSIVAAGFDKVCVFAEPGSAEYSGNSPDSVKLYPNPERLGCWQNYLNGLSLLVSNYPRADAYIMIQDDVVISSGTRPFLESELWPGLDAGAVSLYSPDFYGYEDRHMPPGFNRIDVKSREFLMGACAMVFTPQMAVAFTTKHTSWRGIAKGEEVKDPVQKKAVDTWIGHALKAEGKYAYYPNPSISQHISTTSTLGHGSNNARRKGRSYRKSKSFVDASLSPMERMAKYRPTYKFNLDGSVRLDRHLWVLIPGWNCPDLTIKCLKSLNEYMDVEPARLIYVDNGSEEENYEIISSHLDDMQAFKSVVKHRLPENTGFTGAVNVGFDHIQSHGGGHVLLLNNDAYIHPRCVSRMLHWLLSGGKIASVGPLTGDGGSQSIVKSSKLRRLRGQKQTIERSMVVGFCQLIHGDALSEIGYLDSNLPHGLGTDDDWCVRATRAGWKHLLALDAFCDHDHSQTFKASGQDRKGLQNSAIQYLRKKGTWPE